MRPQTIIADLGASDTILYSRNLPRGKGVRINTLNGNKHGVYQHDVKLAVRSCNGDIIQLKFETVIITNSPINLLSLPQMSANGWDRLGGLTCSERGRLELAATFAVCNADLVVWYI